MRDLAFNFLKLLIKLEFPKIRQITTQEFARWLEETTKPRPFVLDARNQVEYTVSQIKAAERIDPLVPDLAALLTVPKDTPIVVYCSVGYRSSKIAQKLEQEGFSSVFNLSGGIFQWANEGRPLFQGDRPTQFVHPYNARWGKLLKFSGVGEPSRLN